MNKKKNKVKNFTFNVLDALIIVISIFLFALLVYVFVLGHDISELLPQLSTTSTILPLKGSI